ncbi:hypothetical protein PR202_gb21972 [Eleusine coracana subsp. coracana]|uniref:Uncharacterized protein n=1 Tax=Eleusine coracana subsp. coracana TaxID=191504 RepID=A0AAV5FEH5_ELECO|nr:hypothetical protein PR202_gb21972 [Eleusine coracana subsp. coracana]
MASVSTAPRAPLPAAAASYPSSSARQLDPNPSGRFHAARLRAVRRLAGAAPSRRAPTVRCAARSSDADSGGEPRRRGWDAMLHDAFQGAVRRWSEYVSNYWPSAPAAKEAGIGKGIKSYREEEVMSGDEEYEEEEERGVDEVDGKWSWERWKRHFALIEESERLVDELQRAIKEERYRDATYIRDHAGVGLAVHLKPDDSDSDELPNMLREKLGIDNINISSSSVGSKHEQFDGGVKMDDQARDDSDVAAGPAGLRNLSSDSTALPRIKILKVVPMENVNQDYIINIFDQISEDDDDNDDPDVENESSQDIGDEENNEEAEAISAEENGDESGDESDIEALISIDFVSENSNDFDSHSSVEAFERLPARLEKRDRFSFSFYTEHHSKKKDVEKVQQALKKTVGLGTSQLGDDGFVQLDRVKLSGGSKKLSILQLGIKQHNNKFQQKLHGVTHFNRIQMATSSDPLTGLYVTASGFDSEVLSLQRKFGQWQEDNSSEEDGDLLFYEYVEAIKLTGDNLMASGQVARYKGQRKIADPDFQNPRWVDGELLILDGKFIRDGPVIAFFYWTSNFHLFEFFRQLRLPD